MGRAIYLILLGCIGALIVHITAIFLIPRHAGNDAWARLPKPAEEGYFTVIKSGEPLAQNMRSHDPNFVLGACLFDLSEGPFGLAGEKAPAFWSLSVYDRRGLNFFSINDKSFQGADLEAVLATPLQITELQQDMPPELARSVFVEADTTEGFVILRAFVPEPSLAEQAKAFIASSSCDLL